MDYKINYCAECGQLLLPSKTTLIGDEFAREVCLDCAIEYYKQLREDITQKLKELNYKNPNQIFIVLDDSDGYSQDGSHEFVSKEKAEKYIELNKTKWDEYRLIEGSVIIHKQSNLQNKWVDIEKDHVFDYFKEWN